MLQGETFLHVEEKAKLFGEEKNKCIPKLLNYDTDDKLHNFIEPTTAFSKPHNSVGIWRGLCHRAELVDSYLFLSFIYLFIYL